MPAGPSVQPDYPTSPGPGLSPSILTGTRPLDDTRFVLNVTFFILACFGLFAVFTWPRLFTRFSRGSEWTCGHFIYHSTKHQLRRSAQKRRPTISRPLEARYEKGLRGPDTDDDHTAVSHRVLVHREWAPDGQVYLPPHCRSWSGIFQRFSAAMGTQLDDDLSVGRSIILFCYFSIILFASLYKSNPFQDYLRTGFVSTAQIPVIFALGTKNNVIGKFLSMGYEKLNYLHRFAGALAILAANVHAIGYIYEWTAKGIITQKLLTNDVSFGIVGLVAMDVLLLFSVGFWRRRFYNIFLISHVLGIIFLPIGVALHKTGTIPWLVASAGIYGLDLLTRIIKTRICTATLRPIPELGATRIEIPRLNAGWRPGQHVRLRIMSTSLGNFGWMEIHPFTIASASGDGLTLLVKKAGDWSNKLYNVATKNDAIYSGGGNSTRATVWIEGPYGGVGNTMMDSYSGAVFVVGGSGITFALSSIADLVQKDMRGSSRLKVIHLIWCVQDASSLQPMIPTFAALLQQVATLNLQIAIHYTRASTFDVKKVYAHLPPQLTISPGRPRVTSVIDSAIDHSCKLFTPSGREHHASDMLSGLFVGVCGPLGLGEEARKAVRSIDPDRFRKVGGIEVFEETFQW